MEISKITGIYFSPAGSTKKVVENICGGFEEDKEYIDISSHIEFSVGFAKNEIVVLGVPSFGGRVPEIAAKRIGEFTGHKTPCIIAVTYGNRDYDDTLSELSDIAQSKGFDVIGAIAVVCRHSIITDIAAERPDESDISAIGSFVEKIKQKLENYVEHSDIAAIKREKPYKKYSGIPLKPKTGKNCKRCGFCAEKCPVFAINIDYPNKTDTKTCISCMRCITICPEKARYIPKLMRSVAGKKLKNVCAAYRETQFYV